MTNLLTRRLKKLMNEKEEIETEEKNLNSSDIQLLKINEKDHIGEIFRPTQFFNLNWKIEKTQKKGKVVNISLLDMKKKFVKIYLNLKEKMPIAQEIKASGKYFFKLKINFF